jgi:hypothetical protein
MGLVGAIAFKLGVYYIEIYLEHQALFFSLKLGVLLVCSRLVFYYIEIYLECQILYAFDHFKVSSQPCRQVTIDAVRCQVPLIS